MNLLKKYKFYFLGFGIIIIFAIINILFYFYEPSNIILDELTYETTLNDKNDEKITVEIKGAVINPGVYTVDLNSIVNDVVKISGGFKKDAYTKNINLSKKLKDENVIFVYSKNEYKNLASISEGFTLKECVSDTMYIDNCIIKGNSIIDSGINSVPSNNENNTEKYNNNEPQVINLNTATKEELITLSGIGEQKADDIIMYRLKNGPFETIDDLKNVSGIGEKTFDKLKDFITV